jgi:hypothetical protein
MIEIESRAGLQIRMLEIIRFVWLNARAWRSFDG